MPKLTNVRERVHQPFRDALVRTGGLAQPDPVVTSRTKLFQPGRGSTDEGRTNLPEGSQLPSDQSMVVLVLRAFAWFRNPVQRDDQVITLTDGTTTIAANNGDWILPAAAGAPAFAAALNGSAIGSPQDVHRLYFQTEEQLVWDFGAGEKDSIRSMPTAYFPYGGGLHGQLEQTDLILWNNGMPSHEGILRLGRAILIPPRQAIRCTATINAYPAGNNAGTFGSTAGARNMLDLADNLNAVDLINKVITFTFGGLFSRDVQ
jgi:hypothetical protein